MVSSGNNSPPKPQNVTSHSRFVIPDSQVENLSNPTVSLNHNWCNSTNLRRMYEAFCIEISKVREGIDDVRELLQTRRRTAERQDGNEGFSERWEVEWEKCVGELMRLNSGWKCVLLLSSSSSKY